MVVTEGEQIEESHLHNLWTKDEDRAKRLYNDTSSANSSAIARSWPIRTSGEGPRWGAKCHPRYPDVIVDFPWDRQLFSCLLGTVLSRLVRCKISATQTTRQSIYDIQNIPRNQDFN